MPKLTDKGQQLLKELTTAQQAGHKLTQKGQDTLSQLQAFQQEQISTSIPAPVPQMPSRAAQVASKFYTPALGVGGAMAGGALAAGPSTALGPFAPLGIAAGGAGGYAAGTGLARRLDEILGLARPPQGLKAGLQQAIGDIKVGAAGELLGPVAGKTIQTVKHPGNALAALRELGAKRLGITLSPAEVMQSRPVAAVESVLEKTPLGSKTINEFRAQQANQIQTAASNIVENIGTQEAKDITGMTAQKAIAEKEAQRFAAAKKLYELRNERLLNPKGQILPDTVIQTPTLQKTAQRLFETEQQLSSSMQNKEVLGLLKDYLKGDMSAAGAKVFRERLNQRISDTGRGFQSDETVAIYRQLKSALDKDIEMFSAETGGGLAGIQRAANKFYGAQKQLFSGKITESIKNAKPEATLDKIIRPNSVTEIREFKKAAGEQAFNDLKKQFVNRLFEGPSTRGPGTILRQNMEKYGETTLKEVFNKDELTKLHKFNEITKLAGSAEKMAGNPSGTGRTIITWSQGMYILKHPLLGTLGAITPQVLAKAYLNPLTTKLITRGFQMPISASQAGELATRLAAYLHGQNKPQ